MCILIIKSGEGLKKKPLPDQVSRFLISEKIPFLISQWVLTTKVKTGLVISFVSSAFLDQTCTAAHSTKALIPEGSNLPHSQRKHLP